MSHPLQAKNPGRRPDRGMPVKLTRHDQRELRRAFTKSPFATYPVVPAGYPNRATRRAPRKAAMVDMKAPLSNLLMGMLARVGLLK